MRKPSAGGIPAAIQRGLRSFRYAAGDVIFVIGRFLKRAFGLLLRIPVAIWRGVSRFWRSLPVIARRRLVAALGVAAGLIVLLAAVVPNLPCAFPGGDRCPPPDDAQELVPADALAYVHVSLDSDADQFAAAGDLAEKLPVLSTELANRALALIPGPGGSAADFDRDLGPWIGDEVALAAIAGPGVGGERVDLLEVADAEGAAEYAEELATGTPQTTDFEGIEVSVDRRDVATARVEGFLAIGTEAAVRAVIATATGVDGAEPLSGNPTAEELRDELPEDRFAEAWISEEGLGEVIAGDRGALGTLSPALAPGASRGAAVSLSAADDRLELAVRSALDAERAETSQGFFAAFPDFEPTLSERLNPRTLAYVGLGAAGETVASLVAQAAAQAPGIADGFADLVQGLRAEANVDVERELLEGLGEQTAFALGPPSAEGGGGTAALPYLLFLADGVDDEAARRGLAALAGPLAGDVDPGEGGQAPVFGEEEIAGVEASSVRVSPTVELTYAVFDGLAAIATDAAGIAAVAEEEGGGLAADDRYEEATDGIPEQVKLQLYLDLEELVRAGEAAGLAADPVYATFAGDFRRLQALALAVSDDDDVLATDARLLVGPPPAAGEEPSPLPAPGD